MKQKYEIVEQAYCLSVKGIKFPDMPQDTIYYGTRGQAKQQALIDNDACKLLSTGEYLSFKTIKVSRKPQHDKIMFGDKIVKRYQIEELERLENIKHLAKDRIYVVQDRRSYVGNAVVWWGINSKGYVCDINKAHKYTYDELQKFKPRDTDIIWDYEHVMTASKLIIDAQNLQKEFSL